MVFVYFEACSEENMSKFEARKPVINRTNLDTIISSRVS